MMNKYFYAVLAMVLVSCSGGNKEAENGDKTENETVVVTEPQVVGESVSGL